MPRLLALDLATRIGWAHGDTDAGDPASGVVKLPATGEELGPYLAAYGSWLMPMIKDNGIEAIVFEEPIMPRGMTQIATLLKLYNLIGTTERAAYHLGIPIRQVAAPSWKKGFTGSAAFGKAKKPYPPIAKCHALGWTHVRDDNQADALGIWVYSCRFYAPAKADRFDPLFRKAA
jgi:hypothetical protein